MFGLGAGELMLIFGIGILFFGPKKIPELAKGIGQGINEFKKSMNSTETEKIENEKKS
jgi:sec-independent protein translocase protein TatA